MAPHCLFRTEFNIILPSALLVQVPLLSSDFASKGVYAFLIPSYQLWYISHPLHRPLIILIRVSEGYKLWCYSVCISVILLIPVSYIQIFPVPRHLQSLCVSHIFIVFSELFVPFCCHIPSFTFIQSQYFTVYHLDRGVIYVHSLHIFCFASNCASVELSSVLTYT